ncbi:MAG: tRNA-dihydrouridine synthase family protein [Planctomycetaceae bacterium]|nr:tRNA-dihydrouridine synthase family protein [Planctomycetaceae bacterium]
MTNASTITSDSPAPILSSRREGPLEIKPLALGNVHIGFPIVQAALSGYSDWPMRVVARRLGAPYTIHEVVIDQFVLDLKDREKTRHHLFISDEEHPVGGQLMGAQPDDFVAAARKLVEVGFDVIDINFGCPVKSAVNGCRGGYHLGQPDVALDIIRKVREIVPAEIPVTLKLRNGIDDTSESRDQFFEILEGAYDAGIASATVHSRSVTQKYIGPSNWDFLREVKQFAGTRTVLGSGDLFTAQACLDMIHQTGVDGVTVARGAIGNPWIFQQARDLSEGRTPFVPDLQEQRRVLEMQYSLHLDYHPPKAVSTMRKFGIKFAPLHPNPVDVRNAFARIKTEDDWRLVLEEWYTV